MYFFLAIFFFPPKLVYHIFTNFAPGTTLGGKTTAMETLAKAGLFTGVLLMPVLPFITDNAENILALVERAAACGARFIYPSFGVTQRPGQQTYFLRQLNAIYPDEKIGDKYRNKYGNNYFCAVPQAKKLWHLFENACQKAGLLYNMQDIIAASRQGYQSTQLSLFDTL